MSNMVVQTNVMSLNSHRNLGIVGNMQSRASARLSSGFRINSAADDAAGLAISEKMRAQIRGMDQASRNAQDGISLIQTTEGALNTVNAMLIRVRELTNQAANDTNTGVGSLGGSDRGQIAREIYQLQEEMRDMADRIEFNTLTLLDGSLSAPTPEANVFNRILGDVAAGITGLTALNPADLTAAGEAERFIELLSLLGEITGVLGLPTAALAVPTNAADVGLIVDFVTTLQAFGHAITGGTTAQAAALVSAAAAVGGSITFTGIFGAAWAGTAAPVDETEAQGLVDAFAEAQRIVNLLSTGNVEAADRPVWFQVGPNAGHGTRISIDIDLEAIADNLDIVHDTINESPNLQGALISDLLTTIDAQLEHSNGVRAQLGAWQNRLEFTIENLDLASENLSAANSRIRDADMAQEMMRFTQSNVLQQAAISMLAQANQAPQSILQLLR